MKKDENKRQELSAIEMALREYAEDNNSEDTNKASEAQAAYLSFFDNKMQIISLIRKGLPYKLFNRIQALIPFTEEDWADYLSLSTKSLSRYRNESKFVFKPIHTEKIIELTEVTALGLEVFDSSEQFYLWLNTPAYALGNQKPLELLRDSYGKELVMTELHNIEYGIFA